MLQELVYRKLMKAAWSAIHIRGEYGDQSTVHNEMVTWLYLRFPDEAKIATSRLFAESQGW